MPLFHCHKLTAPVRRNTWSWISLIIKKSHQHDVFLLPSLVCSNLYLNIFQIHLKNHQFESVLWRNDSMPSIMLLDGKIFFVVEGWLAVLFFKWLLLYYQDLIYRIFTRNLLIIKKKLIITYMKNIIFASNYHQGYWKRVN